MAGLNTPTGSMYARMKIRYHSADSLPGLFKPGAKHGVVI
jgi:hypothetical protein